MEAVLLSAMVATIKSNDVYDGILHGLVHDSPMKGLKS